MNKWDKRFLEMAKCIASWSKDPSTKCGCVIVRPDRSVCSTGYNGFPRLISDKKELYNDRQEKLKRVIHAEMNAILAAKEDLHGYTVYQVPGMSCYRCAVHMIQVGIKKIVYPEGHQHRADMDTDLAEKLFHEADVELKKSNY